MKASSLDDRDRRPPLESDADFDKSNGGKKKRQNGSLVFHRSGRVGRSWLSLFRRGGRVEHVGILWRTRPRLTSVHVSELISQNVQKRFQK